MNCIPSVRPRRRRSSMAVRARDRTSAGATPVWVTPNGSVISANLARYAASATGGGESAGLTMTQRRHQSGRSEQLDRTKFVGIEGQSLAMCG